MIFALLVFSASGKTETKVVFSEDFENYESGFSYPKLVSGDKFIIEKADNGKSLFSSTKAESSVKFKMPRDTSEKTGISFVLRGKNQSGFLSFYLLDAKQNESKIFEIGVDGFLRGGSGDFSVETGNNATYIIVASPSSDIIDLFLNGKKVASICADVPQRLLGFKLKNVSADGESVFSIDNVLMYTGVSVDGTEDVETMRYERATTVSSLTDCSVAVYVGKSNVLIKGEKSYISEDRSVFPFEENGITYVPVDFFADSIGAFVKSNAEETDLVYNGKQSEIAAVTRNGIRYADLKVLCKATGKYLTDYQNGLLIYSDRDMSKYLDFQSNLSMMRKIIVEFIYDDFTGKSICNTVKSNYPDCRHPRLILTEEKITRIRGLISENNVFYSRAFGGLKYWADRYLKTPPSEYEIRDGVRLLYVCNENAHMMLTCSLMYQLSGEEKYAERAYLAMEKCAGFPDWNPFHFLDVGTLANSMGLCYDWLYNWMNEGQREIVRKALVEKAFYPYMQDLDNANRKRSWNWRGELADNWRMIIMGECTAGLAIFDELTGYDLHCAERAIEFSFKDIGEALMLFSPLGAYEEGVGYWEYATQYYTLNIMSLITAAGTDYGYVDVPGMKLTNGFMLAMAGPKTMFSYHDMGGTVNTFYPPEMMFFANYFGKPAEAALAVKKFIYSGKNSFSAFNTVIYTLLYDVALGEGETENVLPLSAYFPISEVAVFRNNFQTTGTYLAFHCDDPVGGDGHDHMDAGHFSFQCMGEDFFIDLGSENYNIKGGYYNCYRIRAEGHNTVVFNPDSGYDQKWGGKASVIDYFAVDGCGYAVGDLSEAYYEDDGITSFLRGVAFDPDLQCMTVQDEIRLSKPADFWWFAHTGAYIVLSEDGKSASLSKNGKIITVTIQKGDDAFFTVMDAKPLPSSPSIDGQSINDGIKKLAVHIVNCSDIDLVITAAPFKFKNEINDNFEFTPISGWSEKYGNYNSNNDAETDDQSADSTENGVGDGSDNFPIKAVIIASAIIIVTVLAALYYKNKNENH